MATYVYQQLIHPSILRMARLVHNKILIIHDLIMDKWADLAFITET